METENTANYAPKNDPEAMELFSKLERIARALDVLEATMRRLDASLNNPPPVPAPVVAQAIVSGSQAPIATLGTSLAPVCTCAVSNHCPVHGLSRR